VRKPLEICPLGTTRRLEDNIKIDLRDIGCENMRWTELAQDCLEYRALLLHQFIM
jgi:hypothetical protein